jgi:CheY-like chemotaxis protein
MPMIVAIVRPLPEPLRALPASGAGDELRSHGEDDTRAGTGTIRVLIVEDEPFVAMDAEAILVAAGHEVVSTAASAEEAVTKTSRLAPALILMDIRLKGHRDGIDAALEIKRRFKVPIVFVTANVDPATHARAVQAEPLAIISKPFTASSLLAAVNRYFQKD